MKMVLGLVAVTLVLVAGCATTQRVAVEDQPAVCAFLGEACEQLKPGAKGEAGLRYVNPAAQFTQYDKVLIQSVGFFGTDVEKVPPKEQEELTALFHRTLAEDLAKNYQVVQEPGPGVMRVQVAIMNAEAATPGRGRSRWRSHRPVCSPADIPSYQGNIRSLERARRP